MQQTKEGLYHVSQINWVDDTIHRAGITPFYKKGSKYLAGLGVTNVTAVLVTIGGVFDEGDIDLFATAVREYNEETGSKITENDVADCLAIVNKGTINILLPLDERPQFVSNNEIERVLWLTTAQLEIISTNQSYSFNVSGGSTHILSASQSLLNELPLLIFSIDCRLPTLRASSHFRYYRVKKSIELKQLRFSTDFAQLRHDMANPSLFYGSASMVIRDGYVAFQRRDKAVYSFTTDNYDEFMNFIRTHQIKVFVGLREDADKYADLIEPRRLISIEGRIKKIIHHGRSPKELCRVWNNFQRQVSIYRKTADIQSVTQETILIHETEEKIYHLTENLPILTNNIRSSFMEIFELANRYITDIEAIGADVLLWELDNYISDQQKNKEINSEDAIGAMIDLGLLIPDDGAVTVS